MKRKVVLLATAKQEELPDVQYIGYKVVHHMGAVVEHLEKFGIYTFDHPRVAIIVKPVFLLMKTIVFISIGYRNIPVNQAVPYTRMF